MSIPVKTASELSPALKKMWTRAEATVKQQNWDYAFQILRDILLAEPGFNDGRFMLRNAQLDKIGRKTSAVRQTMAMITTGWSINVSGPMQLKKGNFAKALDIGEKAMEADPTVLPTLKYICKVAEAAGLIEVAINALETAVEYHPKSIPTMKQLAGLYERNKLGVKAVSVWQKIVSAQPNNLEAQNRLKHATALGAMEKARWEEDGDFRSKLKDADEQDLLEIANRGGVRDAETRVKVINALVQELEKNPNSISNFRKLAELYHQNGDFDEAVDCYNRVTELTQTKDPAIDSAITNVLKDKYDTQIEDLKAQLEAQPENSETIEGAIEQLEKERDETLVGRYEARVDNYPNEAQFRLDLGDLYLRFERVDEALEQYQHAQRSAHHAPMAHRKMGQCFMAKGLHDLAIEQFQTSLAQRDRMRPAALKAVLYDLGLCQEAKGDNEAAWTTFKEIYGMDVSYRDVTQRMEQHYQ